MADYHVEYITYPFIHPLEVMTRHNSGTAIIDSATIEDRSDGTNVNDIVVLVVPKQGK